MAIQMTKLMQYIDQSIPRESFLLTKREGRTEIIWYLLEVAPRRLKFCALTVRRLLEGGAYLKIGRYKEIFSFNLSAYLPSVRKNYSM